VVNGDIKKVDQARLACRQYGTFASFLDGDTKQDVIDVISRFNEDKSALYQHTSGGDPDDGAYFSDSCTPFREHFGNNDESLYYDQGRPAGKIDCSQQPLSLGRSGNARGRVNDTKDGNGRGAVCELAMLTPTLTSTPTATPSASPTATLTATPTSTPTNTPTNSPTNSPTSTPTPTSGIGGPIETPTPTETPLVVASPTPPPTPQVPVAGIGPGVLGISIITIGSLLVLLGLAL
jgi:hypothetical protein